MMTTIDEKIPFEDRDALNCSGDDMWAEYARGDNIFMNNSENTARRLKGAEKKLFSKEEKMKVDFLDVVQSKLQGSSLTWAS
jgi:hypothetical protein